MRGFPKRQKIIVTQKPGVGRRGWSGASVSGAELWAVLPLVEAWSVPCRGAVGTGIARGLGVSRMVTSENRTPLPRKHTWGSAAG